MRSLAWIVIALASVFSPGISAATSSGVPPIGANASHGPEAHAPLLNAVGPGQYTGAAQTAPAPASASARTSTSASAGAPPPANAAAGPRPFAPGVSIDWTQRLVIVEGRVVLRDQPLELAACYSGKEHESLVRLEGTPTHLFMALGLIGLSPGRPPRWDEARQAMAPAAGDLVDVQVEWQDEGQLRRAPLMSWVEEIEFARPAADRPWVFAGSRRGRDGALAAEKSGVGLALVDFPDSVLSLSRGFTADNDRLWARARTSAIPPVGTAVRLLLVPAAARAWRFEIDHAGSPWIDGELTDADGLIDSVRLARQLAPGAPVAVSLRGTLLADEQRWRRLFEAGGLPEGAVKLIREPREGAGPAPASAPDRRGR